MYLELCVAFLVILVIILLYKWITAITPRESYDKSSGTFDVYAKTALNAVDHLDHPTTDDFMLTGDIIGFNILGGDEFLPMRTQIALADHAARAYTLAVRTAPLRLPDVDLHHIEDFMFEWPDEDLQNALFEVNRPAVIAQDIGTRQANARAGAATREEAVEKFFDNGIVFTANAQSSHDSTANHDLRATFAKFKKSPMMVDNTYADIETFMDRADLSEDTMRKARETLARVKTGGRISTFNDSEDNILATVWNRAYIPENEGNEDLIKEAVIHALADGVDKGVVVCANGRTSRILNSLATLDHEQEDGGALTFEAYRNQIFGESQDIISRELNAAEPELVEAFNSGEGDAHLLIESMKSEIDVNLEQYRTKFSNKEFEKIRADCHAGVDI